MIQKIHDFALNWDYDVAERFVVLLRKYCERQGLSFIWINGDNVREIIKQLEAHTLRINLVLDSQATYNKANDIYARLCYAVKDAGGAVINDPDRAKIAIDKSVTHFELMNCGIKTPYTVVVRNWEPSSFKLTPEEREKLGVPFVIKPALGYGQQGVIRDAKGTIKEIASARNFDKGDNFLLQERVNPMTLNGRRAWFRVIHCFDTIIPCWWDDQQNIYEHVSYEDFNEYGLYKLVKIISKIASFSKMVWFSTEIAIVGRQGARTFLTIDYINDQCDMSAKSETSSGVPDEIVEFAAEKIISVVPKEPYNSGKPKKYKIFLRDASVELKGLGAPQDLLRQREPAN